jgi:hypothetical protein
MWQGEILKCILFPVLVNKDASTIWTAIAGGSPDNFQKRGLPPPMLSVAQGVWRDVQMNVFVQSNRVEVNVTRVDESPDKPTPIPPIAAADLETKIALMREIALSAATEVGALRRIAAVSQLVQEVPSVEDGVTLLNRELSGIFPPNCTDPLYQINVRRPFKSSSAEMNRFCKWGVSVVGAVGVTVDQSGGLSRFQSEETKTYAFLHIDTNTVPSETAMIEAAAARILSKELWDEERNIREKGRRALG